MRAGATALSLLSVPLNVQVLRALEEEQLSLTDLRRATGSPPQTTMRAHLRDLAEAGIVERRRQREFPGTVNFELGRPGRELLATAEVVQLWLDEAPEGPLQLGTAAAKSAIKALVEGWSSAVVRVLAARPLALTELNRLITDLSYPSLERRLAALRLAGQIERCTSVGRGTPYTVSDWLRRSIAPIVACSRWERSHVPHSSSSLKRIDVEAAFLLVVPLVDLPQHLEGTCRLAMELRGPGGESRLAGAMVTAGKGRILSCVSKLDGSAQGWISGPSRSWLDALIDDQVGALEIGGDCELARSLLEGMHSALFGAPERA